MASYTMSVEEYAEIDRLEYEMRPLVAAHPPEIKTDHLFADGMYARILKRKAGTLIVGKIHKREHFYIVLLGRVMVGKDLVYEAGTVIVSPPGTKRVVLALVDSICMTVHRTKKRNLDQIEKQLIEPDTTALFDASNKLKELPCLG